jgi:hypothetical protein
VQEGKLCPFIKILSMICVPILSFVVKSDQYFHKEVLI